MRMSCNGCRVLRKGCVDNCTLRPCLDWIESPESQANATLFLAKFYGRAGLINLIKSGPVHLRPEIFRSLLHEACGRIISPVQGSVGLMCSGEWPRCQAAVEAVLRGAPLMMQAADEVDSSAVMPLQGCDIRHLSKGSAGGGGRVRSRNKRASTEAESQQQVNSFAAEFMSDSEAKFTITGWEDRKDFVTEVKRARSHDSNSVETVEPTLVNRRVEPSHCVKTEPQLGEIGLELTLGPNSVFQRCFRSSVIEISDSENLIN